jgi:hypothetical protein
MLTRGFGRCLRREQRTTSSTPSRFPRASREPVACPAGRGIAHSERSPLSARQGSEGLFGIQSWIALPQAQEETDPSLQHFDAASLPTVEDAGVRARVIAGSAFGRTSPVGLLSEWLYAEVSLAAGARAPFDPGQEERAIYVVEGEVEIEGETFEGPRLLVFHPGDRISVRATRPARLMFLGGAALEAPAISGGISCPRAGNGSSKPKKIGRREDSRRCRAKQSSFRFPNPR